MTVAERRQEIAANLAAVTERIRLACAEVGRAPDEVRLIVVTKFFPASDVRLLAGALAPEAELAAFSTTHPEAGGIASFIGKVRPDDGVEALELSHYPPLTLPGMTALADEALARWALDGLLLLHRTGLMAPGEAIVLVAAAARHRRDAFAAADFAMDHLKSDAWFWKRERRGGVRLLLAARLAHEQKQQAVLAARARDGREQRRRAFVQLAHRLFEISQIQKDSRAVVTGNNFRHRVEPRQFGKRL